mgnify:CR=1 FL=1
METMIIILVGITVIGGATSTYLLKRKYRAKQEETQRLNLEDEPSYTAFV